MLIVYYHVGGLATTNILRLTAGNLLKINASQCTCDFCGSKIPPYLQFPIVSYFICKGKCKTCGVAIPVYPLCLEIAIILGMSIITTIFKFTVTGVAISYVFYEGVRLFVVCVRGKRETNFKQQYVVAVVSMIPFFLASLFISLLYQVV